MKGEVWRGRRVFLTGHTGFKGAWLSIWLSHMGARVLGYSNPAPTDPSLFDVANVADLIERHTVGDIRDLDQMRNALVAAEPDVVIHMAAQPLVRYSYAEPLETFTVNAIGTANLLESVRSAPSVKAVVSITTDKCYENREWAWGYREGEPLGGHDPYSASKACAEIVTAAYRRSFLAGKVAVASARAGNVIGGGDWAADRLVPDVFRSLDSGSTLRIRHPNAIRPWQHVLEPLAGYITLAEALLLDGERHADAWNFGPADSDAQPVGWILDHVARRIPRFRWEIDNGDHVHEAGFLKLDSSKARISLGWHTRWSLAHALDKSIEWHEAWRAGADMREVCCRQIDAYTAA